MSVPQNPTYDLINHQNARKHQSSNKFLRQLVMEMRFTLLHVASGVIEFNICDDKKFRTDAVAQIIIRNETERIK